MVMFPFKPPFTVDTFSIVYPSSYWDDNGNRQGTQAAFEDFARQPGIGYGLWNIPP